MTGVAVYMGESHTNIEGQEDQMNIDKQDKQYEHNH